MAIQTTAECQARIHGLLSQKVADEATSYVTSAMILDFMNEGIQVLCHHGRVYKKSVSITALSGANYYTVPGSTGTSAVTDAYISEVDGIYSNDVEQYLTKIARHDAGRLWLPTTSTKTDFVAWYEYGGTVYLLPANLSSPYTVSLRMDYICLPYGKLAVSTSAPDFGMADFPLEYKYLESVVDYAVFRGKQQYQLHQEAATYLNKVSVAINVDLSQALNVNTGEK